MAKTDYICHAIAGLPDGLIHAVEDILRYLWEDERSDFSASPPSPDGKHIFQSLMTVDRWLFAGKFRDGWSDGEPGTGAEAETRPWQASG